METVWDKSCGWEYELLDLLPPEVKQRVWSRAYKRYLRTARGFLLFYLLGLPFVVSMCGIWILAGAFGLGEIDRFAVEIGIHLVLIHPYCRVVKRIVTQAIRPNVQEEIFLFIQQELSDKSSEIE
jgi:hypothetical protein